KKDGAVSDGAQTGLAALDQITERYAAKGATLEEMTAAIKAVRRKFDFKSITVEQNGGFWFFHYQTNQAGDRKGPKAAGEPTSGKDKTGGVVQQTFSLPKEKHTVSASHKAGNVKVTIASERELEILAMLADAKSEVASDTTRTKEQRSDILRDLGWARDVVNSMGHDWHKEEEQRQGFKSFESWAEVRLTQLVNYLSHLGFDG